MFELLITSLEKYPEDWHVTYHAWFNFECSNNIAGLHFDNEFLRVFSFSQRYKIRKLLKNIQKNKEIEADLMLKKSVSAKKKKIEGYLARKGTFNV